MWVHAAQRVMNQALPRRGWVTWVAAEGSLGLALSGTDACLGGNAGSSGPHLPEVPSAGVQDPQEERQDGRCCQGPVPTL